MRLNKSGFILGFFCFITLATEGQVTSVSPFSRYGLGEIQPDAFAAGFGSGGLTQAFTSPRHINIGNPASFSELRLTSFEVGLSHNAYQQQAGFNSEPIWNNRTNLGYLAIGLPLTKWWGLAASVSPFSQTGFRSAITENDETFGEIEYLLNGAGSISRFQLGNGFKIYKGLSIGASANFIWGRRIQTNDVRFNSRNFYNFRTEDNLFVNGIYFELGFQYVKSINKKGVELVVGGTFNPASSLGQERIFMDYTFAINQGATIIKDTINFQEDRSSSINFPSSMGLGVAFQKRHEETSVPAWMFGAEYRLRNWNDFTLPGSTSSFLQARRFAAGFSIIPLLAKDNRGRSGTFFQRMEYRAGIFHENSFISINGVQIQDYGMNFGLGIPLNHKVFAGEEKYSKITISASLGERGDLSQFDYRERYAMFLIGISINDKWFNKFKYR
jgi:hypothetical protein